MRAIIDPYIRLVDDSPTSPNQFGEVNGGDVIGIVLVAASNTSEQCLVSSISFVDGSAARTSLRSVVWFNVNYWNALLQTFVFNHLLESFKSPAMEGSVVAFSMLSVVSNPVQLLHYDNISFLQGVDKGPADLMQHCICPSVLPSSQPFKPPLCRGGAFRLEGASELPKMSPPMLDLPTINSKTIGSYQEIVNSNINADWVISLWFRDFDKNGDMQVKLFSVVSINEFCISYRILQKLSLVISNSEFRLSPAIDGRNGDFLFISEQSEQSFVQIYRKLPKPMLLLPISLIRFSNSISCPYCKIGGKLKSLTSFIVNKMVQCNRIETSSLPSYLADIVTSVSKGFNSIHKLLRFFFSHIKFAYHSLGSFHRNHTYILIRDLNLSRNSSAALKISVTKY